MVQAPVRSSDDLGAEIAACGWRFETIVHPNGTRDTIQVPLTPEEFLHPKEGYHLPNSTFHDQTTAEARDMLARRYENRSGVGVFSDVLIRWPNQEPKDCCPDVAVYFGLRDKRKNRERFTVATEGIRPIFVLEVVSPRYRKQDRKDKVEIYARAQVQEYGIVDRRSYRNQVFEEVLGYRLKEGRYEPIPPDENSRVRFETIGLWMSLHNEQLVMEDIETGERLKTSRELDAELTRANQQTEQARQQAAESDRRAAESDRRAADLETMLARYQAQFGNLDSNAPETP